MKIKLANATERQIDYLVATCEGMYTGDAGHGETMYYKDGNPIMSLRHWNPSTNWSQGGPIIEREIITLNWRGQWAARLVDGTWLEGPTPLIAAMRCYVSSKLGEEVDVPEELI